MNDTLDCLQIREPLPVADYGTIFWGPSWSEGKPPKSEEPPGDAATSFNHWLDRIQWINHYATPKHGSFDFHIRLIIPGKTNEFERMEAYSSWPDFARKSDYRCGDNWVMIAQFSVLPARLVAYFEELMVSWKAEQLYIFWDPPPDGDANLIIVQFFYCRGLPQGVDALLKIVADELTEVMAKA